MRYAENTSVSSDQSRAEIERTLARYGADQFMYGWTGAKAMVCFRMHERMIRFTLPMPDKEEFRGTPAGRRRRNDEKMLKAWEQATRQRWRAMALAIKAKLEAVESGIAEFESEFLAYIVLPNGSTAGEYMHPQIAEAYASKRMPKMLPMLD